METEPIGSQLQAKRGQNKRRVKVIFGWVKESEDKGWRRTEPESRTSATPWWKPKETHPAGIAQSPLYPCTAHTLPCDWMTRQGWRANWIALASIKGKEQNNSFKLLNRELSLKKEGWSPLASNTRLEVEETNLAGTTASSCHMTEAAAVSSLRVAFVYIPRGSNRITAAYWKRKKSISSETIILKC